MTKISRIEILPEVVASAIAAGEVVERPASVVKELLENSLDAGATRIEIHIEQSGVPQIEVRDNGHGILKDDIGLAVERFATSKLRSPDDLFRIQTLGFRGEALSSIAAVSRMEIRTRSGSEDVGCHLRVEAGEILDKKIIGTPPGTQVIARDLFFNVPARRKFLKSPRTERLRINRLVQRVALAYPDVAIKLMMDDRIVFESSGSGDMLDLLSKVFTREIAQELLTVPSVKGSPYQISGHISPPHLHRSNRQNLTFYVNGRWITDASLNAAVIQAYHGLLMVGRYPITVLHIDLPSEEVDVNVHPMKSEIRFRNPQHVFSLLQRSVRATLLGQSPAPTLVSQPGWQGITPTPTSDWQFAEFENPEQAVLPLPSAPSEQGGEVPLLRPVGQVGRAYLVAEGPDGIYLIDQHAAHERVLYEQYMGELSEGKLESQVLLEALTIEFAPDETELLTENEGQLTLLGFDLEPFGGQSYRLRGIPSLFTGKDPREMMRAVVEELGEDEQPLSNQREALLAARVCKRMAIKSGQLLSLEEQRALVKALEACAAPRTCPHGRPTMIHLPVKALDRQFGRT